MFYKLLGKKVLIGVLSGLVAGSIPAVLNSLCSVISYDFLGGKENFYNKMNQPVPIITTHSFMMIIIAGLTFHFLLALTSGFVGLLGALIQFRRDKTVVDL